MSTVTGHVARLITALGHAEGDAEVQAVVSAIEPEPERERFSGPPIEYVQHYSAGLSLMFERGALDTVVVYAVEAEDFTPYADPAGLIDGIDLRSSMREDVRAVLGEPYRAEEFDLFRVQDDRVIHVDYDEGKIWTVTIMARDVSER